jgi:hypothetical protein
MHYERMTFDLTDPACAYVFGFMQADGNHYATTRNRGHVTVEIKAEDAALLYEMRQVLQPWATSISFRNRSTNFATDYRSARLTLSGLEGRTRLRELGLPVGPKSATIAPPAEPFSHRDYLRGWYDGDGSVGFTATGLPFLSIVTQSPAIAKFVCSEIRRVTGAVRTARPNARDGVSNIMVATDPAADLARWLYCDAGIALGRKREVALRVAAWERPSTMRARPPSRRWWTPEEDAMITAMPIREAAELLGRTDQSVNLRRWRLRKGQMVSLKGD